MHDQGLFKRFPGLVFHSYPISHFRFALLSQHKGLRHWIFTRRGGVSSGPFGSLNVSFNVGDHPTKVRDNLSKIRKAVLARYLITMNQVHGSKVISLPKQEIDQDLTLPECDAVVTNSPGAAVMVKLADCQGVVLYSPTSNVLAVAHCGWRGNVANILGKTVNVMEQVFGCDPREIFAAVSPSLGPCCGEFKDHGKIFPTDFRLFMVGDNRFDLWALSRWQLVEAGVKEENIEVAGVCTRCNSDIFFSYRSNKVTGRFAVVAMLVPSKDHAACSRQT